MIEKPAPASSSLSRRGFVAGALAVGALLALSGCAGGGDQPPVAGDPDGGDEVAGEEVPIAEGGPVDGGTLRCCLADPISIDPRGVCDDSGALVCNALFDTLTSFDFGEGALVGRASTSWGCNEDATEFVFHVREGMTFHNGDPVTAKDFAYAWNRLCDPGTDPGNPSKVAYILAMVEGYDGLVAGRAGARLALDCPDDYTLVVKLASPFPAFPYVVSHPATSPVPESAAADAASFAARPVGNGAFRMEGDRAAGELVKVVRNENYWGDLPHIDGVEFVAMGDAAEAYAAFAAGEYDCGPVLGGDVEGCVGEYGGSPDGHTANPAEQVLLGEEAAVCYLACNGADAMLSNPHLRRAVSLSVDRRRVCDEVYGGAALPADNVVAPVVDGYEEGAWEACRLDDAAAREELELAKRELGVDELEVRIACDSQGGHAELAGMIRDGLEAIGIRAEVEELAWPEHLSRVRQGDYQIACLGWIADYPTIDDFLCPLFSTGSGDNLSGYADPDVDKALVDACAVLDDRARVDAMRAVNRMVAEDLPVIPIVFGSHMLVCSNRVNELRCNPIRLIDFSKCWLSA